MDHPQQQQDQHLQSPLLFEDQENNSVPPSRLSDRLWKKKGISSSHSPHPWQEDAAEQNSPIKTRKLGPPPCASPKCGQRNKHKQSPTRTAWGSNWRKQADALVQAIVPPSLVEEEEEKGASTTNVPSSSSIPPIAIDTSTTSTPASSSTSTATPKSRRHSHNHKHKKSSKKKKSSSTSSSSSSSLQQQQPLTNKENDQVQVQRMKEEDDDEHAELLAIDFDRDGDALREAIADDTLAMWDEQGGLYQDVDDALRAEILKGIVDSKFQALKLEQAQILQDRQLAGMPKLKLASAFDNDTMSIIAEEEEEEEEESSSASSTSSSSVSGNEQDNVLLEEDDEEEQDLEDLEATMTPQERIALHMFQVQEELEVRLQDLDTSEQQCIEATGRLGQLDPSEAAVAIRDYQAFNKFKLHEAVEERVAKIFTDDHLVVSSFDEEDENNDDSKDDAKELLDASSASLPTATQVVSKAQLREKLHSSFSTFDALLQSKQPSSSNNNEDEWTECEVTVTESPKEAMKKLVADMDAKLKLISHPPNITDEEDESFMEFTVKEETVVDVDELSEQREKEKNQASLIVQEQEPLKSKALSRVTRLGAVAKKPVSRVTSNDSSYLEMTVADDFVENGDNNNNKKRDPSSNTLLKDGKVAAAAVAPNNNSNHSSDTGNGNFPTITTTTNGVEDDDLTQITFDHTVDGDASTTQDHYLASAYLNKSSTKPKVPPISPRKYASGVDSQHTDRTRETVPMDDTSFSNRGGGNGEASLDSSSRDAATALSKSVAKILRVEIWSPKPKVVQSALERLAQAASQGSFQRTNIARLGGVIAILRAMQSHALKLDIQKSGCQALAHLSVDRDTQVAIAEVGGTRAIITAMQSHPEDQKVQEAACAALANITRPRGEDGGAPFLSDSEEDDEDGPSSGGHGGVVQALVTAMNKHPQDCAIQAKAFGALANLCLDNQGRLQELSETGGLTAMTLALQKPWANKMDQHEAISTLSILLRSLAELGSSHC